MTETNQIDFHTPLDSISSIWLFSFFFFDIIKKKQIKKIMNCDRKATQICRPNNNKQ